MTGLFDLKNSTDNLGLFKLTNRMAKTTGLRVAHVNLNHNGHWHGNINKYLLTGLFDLKNSTNNFGLFKLTNKIRNFWLECLNWKIPLTFWVYYGKFQIFFIHPFHKQFINLGINAAAREAIRGTSNKMPPEKDLLGSLWK